MLRSLPVGGVPDTKYTKLVFASGIQLDAPSNSYTYRTVWLNNPANVLNTSQAPQSAGNMTTWNAIYGKWTVVGARVTFTVTPTGSPYSNFIPGFLGMYKSYDDGTTLDGILQNGIPQVMEQPRNMTMKALPYGISNSQKDLTISCFVDMAKFFKVSQSSLWGNEDDYSGTGISVAVTAPVRRSYVQIWVGNVGGNNPSPIDGILKVEYIVRWSEPKDTRAI